MPSPISPVAHSKRPTITIDLALFCNLLLPSYREHVELPEELCKVIAQLDPFEGIVHIQPPIPEMELYGWTMWWPFHWNTAHAHHLQRKKNSEIARQLSRVKQQNVMKMKVAIAKWLGMEPDNQQVTNMASKLILNGDTVLAGHLGVELDQFSLDDLKLVEGHHYELKD